MKNVWHSRKTNIDQVENGEKKSLLAFFQERMKLKKRGKLSENNVTSHQEEVIKTKYKDEKS